MTAQRGARDGAIGRLPATSRTAYVVESRTEKRLRASGGVNVADYAVVNPATGETIQEYPTISDDDLKDAIGRAYTCHQEWTPTTTVAERAAMIRKVAEIHTAKRQELGEIITREMGKPIEQALGEVDFSAAIYEYYADTAEKLLAEEPIEQLDRRGLGADPPQLL